MRVGVMMATCSRDFAKSRLNLLSLGRHDIRCGATSGCFAFKYCMHGVSMNVPSNQERPIFTFVEMANELTAILETMRGHTLPPEVLRSAEALCSKVHAQAVQQGHDASELSSARQALRESNARFEALTDAMPQMVWSTQPDGFHDYYNARWYEFTGVAPGSTDGEGWAGMLHPDDQERAWSLWRHSLETGKPYEIEYRLRDYKGEYRWTLGRALPVRDDDAGITRWIGTCTDIDEVKKAAERNELLQRELSHRIKNIFAVIAGLIGLSARRDPSSKMFAHELQERVAALGRSHEYVSPQSHQSEKMAGQSTFHAILREIFSPFPDRDLRFRIEGDDVPVDDRGATPIALIFHELATNAAKYGALSVSSGFIEIVTRRDNDRLKIMWRERGGPAISGNPERAGFGSKLTKISAEQQLGGSIERRWEADGLCVDITIRPSRLSDS
jgi:PAS domain S-box-containing protein